MATTCGISRLSLLIWAPFRDVGAMFDRIRQSIGINMEPGAPQPDPDTRSGVMNDLNEMTTLSWETRLQCFAGCFILSLFCSLCSTALLFAGKIPGFCILVSLGSILSIGGTCFLMGPFKQLQKMFESTRLIATIVYLSMIVLTLIAGLVWHNGALALIFVIGQYIAMAWYSISYIPFARDFVSKILCACLD
uniref:Vesicle transport protein n=1 Tax=Steinernema glaseri TaxID=37863 RepID=A0A1I7YKJ1_9BILA